MSTTHASIRCWTQTREVGASKYEDAVIHAARDASDGRNLFGVDVDPILAINYFGAIVRSLEDTLRPESWRTATTAVFDRPVNDPSNQHHATVLTASIEHDKDRISPAYRSVITSVELFVITYPNDKE